MMVRVHLLFIMLCILLSSLIGPDIMAMEKPEFRGYFKTFFLAREPAELEGADAFIDENVSGSVENRIRVKMLWHLSEKLSGEFAYDLVPALSEKNPALSTADFLTKPNASNYRYADVHRTLYPASGEADGNFELQQNIDRFMFTYSGQSYDLIFGRQPIAFGAARVINPLDVLAPFTYQELDVEERFGIDAIRCRIPLGSMSELDVGLVCGDDANSDNNAAFIRGRGYLLNTDFSAMTLFFRQNLLIGFDIARSIRDAGFWFEAAYVFDTLFDDTQRNKSDDYLRISTGLDYNLTAKLYGYVEYHFNEAGEGNADEYIALSQKHAYTEGSVYLLGNHYLIPGLTYQMTPLWTLTMNLLTNLTDPSTYLSTVVDYSFSDDVYIQGGMYYGLGGASELTLTGEPTEPYYLNIESEFGLYGTFYFTSVRIYL